MPSSSTSTPTAFPTESIKPQTQSGTGLDSELDPQPIYTLLEHFHSGDGTPSLHEYTGSGKLKNKKVLITGGDSDQVERTFQLNVFGMFAITKAALPHMSRGGSIINSTSIAAYQGSPTLVDYASTKGAIVSFSKSLALQLAPRGIRVNAVAPGIIYTALQAATGGQEPETVEKIGVDSAPLGRPGQPSEVAPAYVFLASNESSYTTGAVIHVTGGVEVYS
ncbi:hypothetical protein PSTG_00789 [Puccinia striiformis f. sp. tritici PST-78]|uniref:Oxidoreductase n=1 Tax=Puccinia striiformis f. sp. tritici PST-78 TaxID=1165861 RepID=A0A0L0W410_9BASI|nr:hypothetical protein PSTG_00789 [Puccinia striiformis f. sp. tritici PST-78]